MVQNTQQDAGPKTAGTAVPDLTRDEAAVELQRLAVVIGQADAAYHRDDAPTLSDAEYDAVKQRNAAIEARFADLKRGTVPATALVALWPKALAKCRMPCAC